MAAQSSSTVIQIPPSPPPAASAESELKELSDIRSPLPGTPQRQQKPPAAAAAAAAAGMHVSSTTTNPAPLVIDRTLASVANLAKLLPTGTVLAFQALSPSFANHGACYPSNKFLTSLLLYFCAASCIFFSFTDSLRGRDGKLYYGMATFRGFYVFNYSGGDDDDDDDREFVFKDLRRLRIRLIDYVHAFFSAVVFLTVAFSDADVQNCFFPKAGPDARELLVNLPLGAGFLSSVIFMVFPTTRKSIGYTDSTAPAAAHSQ
ncbi:hypothetical protein ACMD2_15662 [Ananas comosus]|nr:hypothetical protein ACMD2_15662 [Ananas comosus]